MPNPCQSLKSGSLLDPFQIFHIQTHASVGPTACDNSSSISNADKPGH